MSHGNSPPPPPLKNFPRKLYHMANVPLERIPYGKASPSMVNLPPPHTNFMMREQIPWHIAPPPPPEIMPYGKLSPGRNTIWQTFPRKKYHNRTSPWGNNTIWQTPPPPPRKKSHGRTATGGDNTIWQTFPLYGKSLPTQIPYVILGQHVRFLGAGRNPIDGEFLPYGILSGGKEIHGEETPCDTRTPGASRLYIWRLS